VATAVSEHTEALGDAEKPFAGNLSWLLAQASHVMVTEMTRAFEDMGVAPRGHCVLSAADTGEFTQKELAEMVGLDKTTMVVTVDELERAGLAERVPSTTDRRARIIRVTPAGKRVVRKGEVIVQEIQDDVLAALPARDAKSFMGALERLVEDRLATPAACSRAPRRRA
jgi:MarR family transcriptional regulator, transcriptional regulator for hemolysin